MSKAGFWHDFTVIDFLDAAATELPDKVALNDRISATGCVSTFSVYARLVSTIAWFSDPERKPARSSATKA